MRKIIIIFFVFALVFVGAAIVLQTSLPSLASYVLAKLIDGEARISKANITYKAGTIVADFGETQIKGDIEGYVKKWRMVFAVMNGLYLKEMAVTDFDLTFLKAKSKTGFLLVPHTLIEVKRGTITYNQETFFIDGARIENLRAKKPFTFGISVRNDRMFGTLTASGEGEYKGSASNVKGRLSVSSLDLNDLADVMHGTVRTEGPFTYEGKRFIYEGPFELLGYTLKDPIFKKPFSVAEAKGRFAFSYTGNVMDIKIRDGKFKETPLSLDLTFKNNNLARLKLSSGPLEVQDVKETINLGGVGESEFTFHNW